MYDNIIVDAPIFDLYQDNDVNIAPIFNVHPNGDADSLTPES